MLESIISVLPSDQFSLSGRPGLSKGTVIYIYTPYFAAHLCIKEQNKRLWSEDNRLLCDLESEKIELNISIRRL